jgi:hypothetical protein
MPLIVQKWIERKDLRANPGRLYLFGDNESRRGHGGQAAACRGEPNAVGVATKRFASRASNAYWSDAELDRVKAIVDADLAPAFAHLRRGGEVVYPAAGLGTGLSELQARAPKVFAYLQQRIEELKAVRNAGGRDDKQH